MLRGLGRTGLLTLLSAIVSITSLPAAAQTTPGPRRVELELVLAIDTSTSVDAKEFTLQNQGLAQAFRHPDVLAAIKAVGPRGIAVSLVQWAGIGRQATSVEWTLITDQPSALTFAAKIAAAPRQMRGFTDIGGAIGFSTASLQVNGFAGARQVIDVSGDGTSSSGSPALARDQALALGITINGLIILNVEVDLGILADIDLEDHFRSQVIGGPGAFLMVAEDFDDFARAMRAKLIREIIGPLFSGAQNSREFADITD